MSTPLTIPQFVHENAALIIAEMKADLELRTNHSFAPADVEMLLINGFAYREMLLRGNINDTARQNLVDFGRGPMLDYLGALVGVTRLPASGALTRLQYSIVAGHTGVTIPVGHRVQSTDGKVIFITTEEKVVATDTFTAVLHATASPAGKIGNGYAIGTIAIILDPLAFVTAASNLGITIGGADDESDAEMRERIKLAPSAFSVAGPTGAYKYWAKSASALIVDVAVNSPAPGVVNIYPLLADGGIPGTPILDAVNAICNAEKIRPLTDTVNVIAPTAVNYAINVQLTKLPDADTTEIVTAVTAKMEAYKADRLNRMAVDAVINQIVALCMVPGVYNVTVVSPVADVAANENEFTNCTGITVSVTGTHNE